MAVLATVSRAAQEETCHDQATCENVPVGDAARADAMLQIAAESIPRVELPSLKQVSGHVDHRDHVSFTEQTDGLNGAIGKDKADGEKDGHNHLQAGLLQQSRSCLPKNLQELHLRSLRKYAAFLTMGRQAVGARASDSGTDSDGECSCDPNDSTCLCSQKTITGATAGINPAGFTAVTKLCCPSETEAWFNRVLEVNGFKVCSKPHIQGLMHWFTCVPDMDPEYVMDVIKNGNPCKYWAPKDMECPALSAQCQGTWCR